MPEKKLHTRTRQKLTGWWSAAMAEIADGDIARLENKAN